MDESNWKNFFYTDSKYLLKLTIDDNNFEEHRTKYQG